MTVLWGAIMVLEKCHISAMRLPFTLSSSTRAWSVTDDRQEDSGRPPCFQISKSSSLNTCHFFFAFAPPHQPPNLQLPQPFIKDGALTEIQRDKGCDSAAERGEEGTDEMLIFVPQQRLWLFDMCDEWCWIGTAELSPPLIVTSPETKRKRNRRGRTGGKKEKKKENQKNSGCFLSLEHTHTHTQSFICNYICSSSIPQAHTHNYRHQSSDTGARLHTPW